MVARRDKKAKRQRGSKTHGCGSMKKRRGAGNRGGRGNAGSGKRADTIKPSLWKSGRRLEKRGFKKKNAKPVKTITIRELEAKIDSMVKSKLASSEKSGYAIDLSKAGYSRLLANGKASKKMDIKVKKASKRAIDKISGAGGSVNLEGE